MGWEVAPGKAQAARGSQGPLEKKRASSLGERGLAMGEGAMWVLNLASRRHWGLGTMDHWGNPSTDTPTGSVLLQVCFICFLFLRHSLVRIHQGPVSNTELGCICRCTHLNSNLKKKKKKSVVPPPHPCNFMQNVL